MKKVCVVFTRSPHGSASGREGLDLAMLAASYDFETSLLFVDEGTLHLQPGQCPEAIGCRDYIATLKALEFYDIEQLLVCEASAREMGLWPLETDLDVQILSAAEIGKHLAVMNEVIVF